MCEKNNIMKYVEPATIVTLITGGMYLAGRNYIGSYFARFGINHNSLDYPTLFYLVKGFYPLLLCSIIIFCALFIAKEEPNNLFDYLKGNFLAFGIAIVLIYGSYGLKFMRYYSQLLVNIVLLLSIFLFILSIIATVRKMSLSRYLLKMSPLKRFLGLFLLLLFCNIITVYLGNRRSSKLIEGKDNNTIAINFVLKNNSKAMSQVANKDFILIEYRNGKYFVIPKTRQIDVNPELFIIPENEISMAKITH